MSGPAAIILAAVVLAAQDRPFDLIPVPDPVSGHEVVVVSGRERLAWDQQASSHDALRGLGYAIYIDGARDWLRDVSCASSAGPSGFGCSAPLPRLQPGLHTIELASYVDEGARTEGERSGPVRVQLGSPSSDGARSFRTADAQWLQSTPLATDLDDAMDVIALPGGRALIAERGGRVRVYRDGALRREPAFIVPDLSVGDGRGLLALETHPEFETNGVVFLAYTTDAGLRLARVVVFGDTLVDHATLLEGLPIGSEWPRARMSIGPDHLLYLAIDAAGDRERVSDRGSYSGKVLRLNLDGTTPDDQPGRSPVYVEGMAMPAGMAWAGDPSVLWLAGDTGDGAEALHVITGGGGGQRPVTTTRLSLPMNLGVFGMALYGHDAIPGFHGNLLLAGEFAHGILRVRLEPDGSVAGTEWLLRGSVGPIKDVAVSADGVIYVCTPTTLLALRQRSPA